MSPQTEVNKRNLNEVEVTQYSSRVSSRDKRKVLNNTSRFVNNAYGLDTEKGESVEIFGEDRRESTSSTHFLGETRLGS